MQRDRNVALGSLAVVVAACLFGTLGSVSRLADTQAGVGTIAFVTWRSLLGATVVAGLIAVRVARGRPLVGPFGLPARARISLAVAALAGIVLNLAIFVAFGRIAIALALLGFYTYPALVTGAAIALERRRPDRFELAALGMALAGMAIVVLGGIDPAVGLTFDPLGLSLALLAAVAQAVFVLVSRHGFAEVPTDEASFSVLFGGFLGFVAVALVTGSLGAVGAPLGSGAGWPYLIAGGVFGAGIPTTLFLLGIRWIGGVRSGILALIEPVVGAALAALLLGQTLRPIQLVGGVLVLAAAAVLQLARPEPPARAPVDEAAEGQLSEAPPLL
jgi:drug/metabolite transporter (DMT)-like permease